MGFYASPAKQQGQYRYDPANLDQKGPARLFPYAGEDGTLRYILDKLRHNLLNHGQLSQPLNLLLQQFESTHYKLEEGWALLTTLLVDLEIFQSGWFNFSLPPNEQFDANFVRERRSMTLTLLAAETAAKPAIAEHKDNPSPDLAGAVRSRFYAALEVRGRSRPVISRIFERDGGLSDREFARQRLAGQNPMIIRRAREADQTLLQNWTEQSCRLATGEAIELGHAALDNRLFIADYPLLQHLSPSDLQPGRYVGSPIAVFYRSELGLEPVLIQLEPGRVVTTSTSGADADEWMRAKLFVQTADVTHHELIDHLCNTHLLMEAFAIATPRQLPSTHPLYRLLRPHFQFLLAINTRGNTILLGEGAAIDTLMAPTRAASLALINQAYRDCPFQHHALPTDIQRRGLEPEFLPEFPYRDDAVLLWEAITRYVTQYLHQYYPDDRAIQQDPYLQAWAAELGAPLESRPLSEFAQAPAWLPPAIAVEAGLEPRSLPNYPRIPGFPAALPGRSPGELTNLQQLIDVATQIIFTCGPQHAAVNFSQFDYVGYTPNAPLAVYDRPHASTPLENLLPSPEQDLGQMKLAFALSGIRWGHFGSSDAIQFVSAGDRQVLEQFQSQLQEIEAKIHDRNQQRLADTGIEYPYLLPSRIPNSINI